jgi:hypothetical protein
MQRDYQPIVKPSRIKDPAAIAAARKDYCEYCGNTRGPFHCHHVKSRGSGGPDIPSNLVNLCWLCHDGVHRGRIPRANVLALLAAREALGSQACPCGCNRRIWRPKEGLFRCYQCNQVIASSESPPPG